MATRADMKDAELRRRAKDLRLRGSKMIEQAEQLEALADLKGGAWRSLRSRDQHSFAITHPRTTGDREEGDSSVWAAEASYLARRRRDRFFPTPLFGEPAWDILLDLYLAGERGTPVSISSACLAGGTAPTTGLRWLSILDEHGLIERERNSSDGRMSWVRLSAIGRSQMRAYLADALSLIAWGDGDSQSPQNDRSALARTG